MNIAKRSDWLSFFESHTFFVACIILGVVFRVSLAVDTSFWLDELWSSYWSDPAHSLQQVINYSLADVHPPLYQIILHYWFVLFGYTEFSGRMLSLAIGLLAIPAFHFLAKTLYDEPVARLATIIFSLSPSAAAFSAEVRSYELLLLFAITSTACLAASVKYQKPVFLIAYFLNAVAIVYTHYFGFILLLTQGVCWLILLVKGVGRKTALMTALAYLLLLVAFLPLAHAMLGNLERQTFWIHNPTIMALLSYIPIYFGGPFAAPAFVLAFVILVMARPQLLVREALLLLSGGLILLVPYLMGFVINPVITVRNTIIAVPHWALLAGWVGGQASARLLKMLYILMFVVIAILGIILTPIYKGEDIDRLLEAFLHNPAPVYLVKTPDLATDTFLRTKITLNREKYSGLGLVVAEAGKTIMEPTFWLACYHTCDKVNMTKYLPKGYRVIKQVSGKGVRGMLIEVPLSDRDKTSAQ